MKRITRAKAVKIFCQTCMGCDDWYGGKVGTTPVEASYMVKKCESITCPLYNFRTGAETTPGKPKKTRTVNQENYSNSLRISQKTKLVEKVA